MEELTPPVIGDVPWLTASAHRICDDPTVDRGARAAGPTASAANESPAG